MSHRNQHSEASHLLVYDSHVALTVTLAPARLPHYRLVIGFHKIHWNLALTNVLMRRSDFGTRSTLLLCTHGFTCVRMSRT